MKIKVKNNELRKMLLKKGFSQLKLANKANISRAYLNQIINGDRCPGAEVAKNILDTLGLEFDDIFFIDDANKSELS